MRISIATTSGFHLRHLARECIRRGEDVRFLSYLPGFRMRRDGIPDRYSRSLFARLQPLSTLALCRHLRSMQRLYVEKMLQVTDRAVVKSLPECDTFVGLSGMAIACAQAARARYGAKVFIDRGSHHVLNQNRLRSADGGSSLSKFYVQRELESYSVADYITLPSTPAVESFVQHGFPRSRLFLNPYGVDLDNFRPAKTPALPVKLLFLGAWSHQKGADVMARAIDELPQFTLTHAGMRVDVPYPATNRFRAVGHICPTELPKLFAQHHILLLPSRQDGFGMVLLEALACGLNVVASRMTGGPDIREAIERKTAVTIVQPGSVPDLMRGIRESCGSLGPVDSPRNILSDAEKAFFSWSGYAARYLDFMRTAA